MWYLVWYNKYSSGISPKSCSNPSVHSWDVLPGAERGGRAALHCVRWHWGGLRRDQFCQGVAVQSLVPWAEQEHLMRSASLWVWTPLRSTCASASTLAHVGLSAPGSSWELFSAQNKSGEEASQVDCLAGTENLLWANGSTPPPSVQGQPLGEQAGLKTWRCCKKLAHFYKFKAGNSFPA